MKLSTLNTPKPWDKEPSELTWVDKKTGLCCEIFRHPTLGHLCGYVNIEPNHPLNEIPYDCINFNVHGGITFSDYLENSYIKKWKLGFDCAHWNDITPFLNSKCENPDATYKTIEYVKNQCKKLAKQIWNYKK